ncbi:hypothetical protein EZS27_000840 [termite gut metagenome]|uniref:Uncharacterized protein n=1 Tax=termite gut metagenome TaxID=433724 RepID=A0A5J4T2L5_9ZZZZ
MRIIPIQSFKSPDPKIFFVVFHKITYLIACQTIGIADNLRELLNTIPFVHPIHTLLTSSYPKVRFGIII